jgi:hypothetical protein
MSYILPGEPTSARDANNLHPPYQPLSSFFILYARFWSAESPAPAFLPQQLPLPALGGYTRAPIWSAGALLPLFSRQRS